MTAACDLVKLQPEIGTAVLILLIHTLPPE